MARIRGKNISEEAILYMLGYGGITDNLVDAIYGEAITEKDGLKLAEIYEDQWGGNTLEKVKKELGELRKKDLEEKLEKERKNAMKEME